MTTYNSYQEAKIANPELNIYWLESRGLFLADEISGDVIMDTTHDSKGYYCAPADHCMTVEQFLKAGHKFVEGDLCLGRDDKLLVISGSRLALGWNDKSQIIDGIDRYILRAAALEEKPKIESDYDKGMREAMKKIAKSCGKSFCVDIGYEDLPDLVESLINPKPEEKPKRVEYVKVEDSIFDLQSDFESGCLFGDSSGLVKVSSLAYLGACYDTGTIYCRIETEITERDEFINECIVHGDLIARDGAREVYGNLFDSGKFKLVE